MIFVTLFVLIVQAGVQRHLVKLQAAEQTVHKVLGAGNAEGEASIVFAEL